MIAFTYNWALDLNTVFDKQLHRLLNWSNARCHLTSCLLSQKLGLFHHTLFADLNKGKEGKVKKLVGVNCSEVSGPGSSHSRCHVIRLVCVAVMRFVNGWCHFLTLKTFFPTKLKKKENKWVVTQYRTRNFCFLTSLLYHYVTRLISKISAKF